MLFGGFRVRARQARGHRFESRIAHSVSPLQQTIYDNPCRVRNLLGGRNKRYSGQNNGLVTTTTRPICLSLASSCARELRGNIMDRSAKLLYSPGPPKRGPHRHQSGKTVSISRSPTSGGFPARHATSTSPMKKAGPFSQATATPDPIRQKEHSVADRIRRES